MPCYHPILAWRTENNGITLKIEKGIPGTELELPCRKCIGCRLDIARQWAIRCIHEAQMHKETCFLTLTYNQENLPEKNTLVKKHLQLFFKRLRDLLFRANTQAKIRYYAVGEYGSKGDRPHYHILLFGFNFPDRRLLYQDGKTALSTSAILQDLWHLGYSTIGDLNFDTACYCARYVQKKYIGDDPESHYQGRLPEFALMSKQNGGIGKSWFDKYKNDLYNHDQCVIDKNFISRPPAFYDRELKKIEPEKFEQLQQKRREKAKENPDNTPERRAVLKQIQLLKQEEKNVPLTAKSKKELSQLYEVGRNSTRKKRQRSSLGAGGAKPPVRPSAQPISAVGISKNNPLDTSNHEKQLNLLDYLAHTSTQGEKKYPNKNLGSVPSALRPPEQPRSAPGVDRQNNQSYTRLPATPFAPASIPNIKYI